jgi:hypothetical protein
VDVGVGDFVLLKTLLDRVMVVFIVVRQLVANPSYEVTASERL